MERSQRVVPISQKKQALGSFAELKKSGLKRIEQFEVRARSLPPRRRLRS